MLNDYKLWVFRPAEHLDEKLPEATREHYLRRIGGFDQKGRERILTQMMRITLLKRLERPGNGALYRAETVE